MHTTYVSDRPGDCPICNMKLVPIKGDTATSGQPPHPREASAVPDRIVIQVSPEKRHLIGLRTSTVERRELRYTLRTTGTFQHDETALSKIAPRFGGWVRRLYVNYTGQEVEKGQPLLTVYSPDLLVTERDDLLAVRQYERMKSGSNAEQREAAHQLLESARQRLKLWEIGDEEIRALEEHGQPSDELLLRAPVSGHVIAKTAVEGKAFMPGETLFEIGQLSRLWVRAAVFESELPRVKVGQKARVILPYLGNNTYETSVAFIYPHIDPQTRRAEVRLELDNPKHELRPDMWANVEIDVTLGEVLAVPASAVIDTGTRFVAFVEREDDRLEPRDVKIGARTDDDFEVRDGLKDGEKVVTRALFLIDSESQLKAALAGMGADTGAAHGNEP